MAEHSPIQWERSLNKKKNELRFGVRGRTIFTGDVTFGLESPECDERPCEPFANIEILTFQLACVSRARVVRSGGASSARGKDS
jgi:hypothetical protein